MRHIEAWQTFAFVLLLFPQEAKDSARKRPKSFPNTLGYVVHSLGCLMFIAVISIAVTVTQLVTILSGSLWSHVQMVAFVALAKHVVTCDHGEKFTDQSWCFLTWSAHLGSTFHDWIGLDCSDQPPFLHLFKLPELPEHSECKLLFLISYFSPSLSQSRWNSTVGMPHVSGV